MRLVLRHVGAEVLLEVVERLDRPLDQAVVLDVVHRGRSVFLLQLGGPALVLAQGAAEALEPGLGQLDVLVRAVVHLDLVEPLAHEPLLELELLLEVPVVAADPQLVERRLGDVHVALLDQLLHMPEEEREDERANVGPVDVGVAGDDDLVVAGPGDVELLADARADRGDHGLDLVVGEHLVDAGLLDVVDLAAEREDGLEAAIAGLDGRAAGAVALDQVDLGRARVVERAVGELARQPPAAERGLAPDQVTRLAGGLAGPAGGDQLVHDLLGLGGVLLEVLAEPGVARRLDQAADPRVPELGLRLALELRVAQLDRYDRGQPLADVVARERLLLVLQKALVAGVVVERAGERPLEAGQVSAALVGVDVVGERERRLHVGAVPLHRHLDLALVGHGIEVDDVLVDALLAVVHVGDEVADAALEPEIRPLSAGALVGELDAQPTREKRHLAQALRQRLERVVGLVEDVGVGQERDRRTPLGALLALRERPRRVAALVALAPDVAVAVNLEVKRLGERVHD